MAVHWFARCAGIKRTGPFDSQLEATAAIKGLDGEPIEGAFVWPETTKVVTTVKAAPKVWPDAVVGLIKWRDSGTDRYGEDLVLQVLHDLNNRDFLDQHAPGMVKAGIARFHKMSKQDQEACVRDVLDEHGDQEDDEDES
jgi:hypothetical protein